MEIKKIIFEISESIYTNSSDSIIEVGSGWLGKANNKATRIEQTGQSYTAYFEKGNSVEILKPLLVFWSKPKKK